MGSCYLIIIDGLGVGAQEDAFVYGDEGTNTLGHVVAQTRCRLPFLGGMGLGNIIPLDTVPPVLEPLAAWGKMRAVSGGKDSTSGHWEIAGIQLEKPFPTYPDGFPTDVLSRFSAIAGCDSVLGNKPASGTDVIAEYGLTHRKTGQPIVYTSADSVFQVAAHVETVPLEKLYDWCRKAREQVLTGDHAVGRVIARPFGGSSGEYYRLSDHRKDYSLKPPNPCLPVFLSEKGVETVSVGKVIDLFGGVGFERSYRTKDNASGLTKLEELIGEPASKFVFANLIETDQEFGHRNDVEGFAGALKQIDHRLEAIMKQMKEDDLMILTGDHGNDPTTPGTDHTREFTPVLLWPGNRASHVQLQLRNSFSDIAVSVCKFFGLENPFPGDSFLK